MLKPNQHVAISGLAAHPVNGVVKFSNTRSWGVWIPGPSFDEGWDAGFFCYCPESTLTVLDLPDHVWTSGPPHSGDGVAGACEHCPAAAQPVPDLSEDERRILARAARMMAQDYADPRYCYGLTKDDRIAGVRRWESIANRLHLEIFGMPNEPIDTSWIHQ